MTIRSGTKNDAVEATKFQVLTTGLIAGLLILWLAGSFWVDAWYQYQQTQRIQTLIIDNDDDANVSILNRSYELISDDEFARLQIELYERAHPSLTKLVADVEAKQRVYKFEQLAARIQQAVRANYGDITPDAMVMDREGLEVALLRAIDATQLLDSHGELVDFITSYVNNPDSVVSVELLDKLNDSVASASAILFDSMRDVDGVTEDLSRLRSVLVAIDTSTSQHILDVAERVEFHSLRRMFIDSLLIAICLWIGVSSQRLLGHIHRQAYYDGRTNLPNRFMFQRTLHRSLARLNKENERCALSIIEINNIDVINDSFGRDHGDKILRLVGEGLVKNAGLDAQVAVIGDYRFAVLFEHLLEYQSVEEITQCLVSSCENGFSIEGVKIHPKLSAGISYSPEHGGSPEVLMQKSELAMVLAGKSGDKQVLRFDDQLSEQQRARIQLEIDLRTAVRERQFELYYQPKVCTSTGQVRSVEALIRWRHPTRGMVSPFHFISVAEECGLIGEIGAWVIDEAIRQILCWQRDGVDHLQVAVNVSAYQFLQEGFTEQVISAVMRHGLPENSLEIEITESVAMADIDTVISGLTRLRSAGITIAIDDFGTDYSSLKVLDDLPVDVLKIDRAFITRLDHIDCERSLINAIVHMARTLGLKTVAEGVETEEQLNKIMKIGCDYIQGYYFSKPVPAEELLATVDTIESCRTFEKNRVA